MVYQLNPAIDEELVVQVMYKVNGITRPDKRRHQPHTAYTEENEGAVVYLKKLTTKIPITDKAKTILTENKLNFEAVSCSSCPYMKNIKKYEIDLIMELK